MKEMRCILFTDDELVRAVAGHRHRRGEELPEGAVTNVKVWTTEPVAVTIHFADEQDNLSVVTLPVSEIAAALVGWCIDRRIMLPKGAERTIEVIDGSIALVIALKPEQSALVPAEGVRKARSFARPSSRTLR